MSEEKSYYFAFVPQRSFWTPPSFETMASVQSLLAMSIPREGITRGLYKGMESVSEGGDKDYCPSTVAVNFQ